MENQDDTGNREGANARAEILYAAPRIIERSTDPSITAEARKIVRVAQEHKVCRMDCLPRESALASLTFPFRLSPVPPRHVMTTGPRPAGALLDSRSARSVSPNRLPQPIFLR